MIVMKRDGREDQYTKTKIHTAISKAIAEVTNGAGDNSLATVITNRLDSRYRKRKRAISVEEIQDDIETELMKEQAFDIAKAYVRYRYQHEINRNGSSSFASSFICTGFKWLVSKAPVLCIPHESAMRTDLHPSNKMISFFSKMYFMFSYNP